MAQFYLFVCSVVDVRDEECDVYIGRAFQSWSCSVWANPYKLGRDGTRAQVIELYRNHLLNSPGLLEQLPTLKNKVLGCWCRALPCHGDVIAEMVNRLP